MAKRKFDCENIGPVLNDLFGTKFDDLPPDTRSDITRRIQKSLQRLNAVAAPAEQTSTLPAVRVWAENRFEALMRMANMTHLAPGNARGLQYLMARHFNIGRVGAGLVGKLTDAGAVKQLVHRIRKYGSGEAYDLLANVEFLSRNLSIERELGNIRRRFNIPKNEWDRLKLDLLEVGLHPYNQRDFGIVGPEGIEFLRGRQRAVRNKMNGLGLSEDVQNKLAELTKRAADSYAEVYEVIRTFGVRAENADGLIRYFPREISANAVRNIHWERAKEGGFRVFDVMGRSSVDNVSTVFTKSRNSFNYIVEDSIVMNEALMNAVPNIYEKMGVVGLDDLISDSGKLTRAFTNHIDEAAPDLFNALVETGIISKIPMTTSEVFDYAVRRYQLPFRNLDEFVATDLSEAAELYRNSLERSVGRSVLSNFVAKASIEGGWGVTEAEKLANPALYGDFVQLTSPSAQRLDVAIPSRLAEQFSIPTFQNTHTYVHPTVAKMFRAEMALSSKPAHMGSAARLFDAVYRTFDQTLISSGYPFRQSYAALFQTFAAGGRPDMYVSDYLQSYARMAELRRQGKTFDQYHTLLDDTRKIFRDGDELISERELWRRARRKGALQDILPWGSRAGGKTVYNPRFNPGRQIAYTRHLAQSFADNPHRLIELPAAILEGINSFTSPVTQQLGLFNSMFDNIGRFATLKTRLSTSPTNQLFRVLEGAESSRNLDEAISVVDEFFFDFSNTSTVDQVAQFVIPFWRFRSRNPPAIIKMAIRRPSKFMAYQRLWAAMNEPEREEIIRGSLPEYAQGYTDLVWKDGDTIFSMPRASFDSISEGVDSIGSMLSFMGVRNSPYRSLDDVPWRNTRVNQLFMDAANASFGWVRGAFAGITGEDPRTGRELNDQGRVGSSLLGVSVPPLMKYVVENMFPIVGAIDRSNPFGWFGTPTIYNRDGTVAQQATPSWSRAPGDQRSKATRFNTTWQRAASVAGFNVYSFSEFDQLGYTEDDLQFTISDGVDTYNQMRRGLILDWDSLSRSERDERENNLQSYRNTIIKLAIDLAQLRAWGAERGMDFSGVLRSVRRNNRAVESYRGLTEDELNDRITELEEFMPLPNIPIN